MIIKTVLDPTLICEGCIFDDKFECLGMPCFADEANPIKDIEIKK